LLCLLIHFAFNYLNLSFSPVPWCSCRRLLHCQKQNEDCRVHTTLYQGGTRDSSASQTGNFKCLGFP
jgi:hypothetical protein